MLHPNAPNPWPSREVKGTSVITSSKGFCGKNIAGVLLSRRLGTKSGLTATSSTVQKDAGTEGLGRNTAFSGTQHPDGEL
jgi:hypothetical protein